VRGNRKLRKLLERVNEDTQLKGWWHASNVNAVARMQINDHSWVHIQIVANIGLKLLRQLTKHHIPAFGRTRLRLRRHDAEVVVLLGALTHCVGMSVHREDTKISASSSPNRSLREHSRHLSGAGPDNHRLRGARRHHESP